MNNPDPKETSTKRRVGVWILLLGYAINVAMAVSFQVARLQYEPSTSIWPGTSHQMYVGLQLLQGERNSPDIRSYSQAEQINCIWRAIWVIGAQNALTVFIVTSFLLLIPFLIKRRRLFASKSAILIVTAIVSCLLVIDFVQRLRDLQSMGKYNPSVKTKQVR